jgi:hypothetical protein
MQDEYTAAAVATAKRYGCTRYWWIQECRIGLDGFVAIVRVRWNSWTKVVGMDKFFFCRESTGIGVREVIREILARGVLS